MKVLRVTAGGREFGLHVDVVDGIDCPRRCVRLPGAPAYVRGVSEVRDQVVAVVDLASRLGLEAGPLLPSKGVVVIDSSEPVAVWVEGVHGVAWVDARESSPAESAAGVRALGDGVVVLDGEALVDGRELVPIASVLDEED